MFRTTVTTLALIGSATFAKAAPLAESIPGGAIVYAEAQGFDKAVATLRTSEFVKAFWHSPSVEEFKTTPDYAKLTKAKKIAELLLGMDLWNAAAKLLGGDVAMALYPRDGDKENMDFLLAIRPASKLAYYRQRLWLDPLLAVGGKRIKAGVLFDTKGVKAWQTKGDNGEPAYILLGRGSMVVSNRQTLLEKSIKLPPRKSPKSMAASAGYAGACEQLGADGGHLLRAFIDTGAIARANGGRLDIPEKAEDAFGSFLFGGLTELIATSSHAGVGLRTADGAIQVQIVGDGDPGKLPEHFRVYFPQPPASGSRPIPQIPGLLAGATIYRELGEWYRGREDYLQPAALPGFDKFESGIGNLLPDHDIGDDVLPLFGSNFTLVSALQDFEHLDGKPGVQLPAFAVIASLKEPEEAGDVVQLLFQTFLSVLNLQAAEQKRQPWLIETELHEDTKITFARYLEKPEGEALPTIFNFRPAAARVGDEYIVSSSLALCRSLVENLQTSDRTKVAPEDFLISLKGTPLRDLISANREHFEVGRVNKGRNAAEARRDVEGLETMVEQIEALRMQTSSDKDGFEINLSAKFKPAPLPAPVLKAPSAEK